jgi:hypothetical protein
MRPASWCNIFCVSNGLQRSIASFLWLNVFKLSQNINISRPCGSNWTNVGSLESPHFFACIPRIKLLATRNHIVPMAQHLLNCSKTSKLQYLKTLWFKLDKCWIVRKPSFFPSIPPINLVGTRNCIVTMPHCLLNRLKHQNYNISRPCG